MSHTVHAETEKRTELVRLIMDNTVTLNDINSVIDSLNMKQTAIVLEAIEEITNKKMKLLFFFIH